MNKIMIVRTPRGLAPESARKELVGLTFPTTTFPEAVLKKIRKEGVPFSFFLVSPYVLTQTLQENDRLNYIEWLITNGVIKNICYFVFDKGVCEIIN